MQTCIGRFDISTPSKPQIIIVQLDSHSQILFHLFCLGMHHKPIGITAAGVTTTGRTPVILGIDPRLTDQLVPQQLPQHAGVLALHVELVMLEHQLGLPVPFGAFSNEGGHPLRQDVLAESIQDPHDGLRLDVGGHGGVERVGREGVLVDVLGSRHRFGDGHEEIVGGGVEIVEGLEVDGAVGAGPAGAGGVVRLEGEGGKVRAERGRMVVVAVVATAVVGRCVVDDDVGFGGHLHRSGVVGGGGGLEEGLAIGGSLDELLGRLIFVEVRVVVFHG